MIKCSFFLNREIDLLFQFKLSWGVFIMVQFTSCSGGDGLISSNFQPATLQKRVTNCQYKERPMRGNVKWNYIVQMNIWFHPSIFKHMGTISKNKGLNKFCNTCSFDTSTDWPYIHVYTHWGQVISYMIYIYIGLYIYVYIYLIDLIVWVYNNSHRVI